MSNEDRFERHDNISHPGIVGASWWQESLANVQAPMSRRRAIGLALGATGAVAGLGVMIALISRCSSDDDDMRVERMSSLDMQKLFGWSFGAAQESVSFNGVSTQPFDREALVNMARDFAPRTARHTRYYAPTLFESPFATPTAVSSSDPETIVPIHRVLSPIFTKEMRRAYFRGRALASLFEGQPSSDIAVIVDLNGPEAVAFAAGAEAACDPIFTFANWPHPRGVVKAHDTLAAAAYFQPLFAQRKPRDAALPLFVLDVQRLAPYTDDATQFDNRYGPSLPDARELVGWGIKRVLYVTASQTDPREQVDLNDSFVAYKQAGIDVKLVGADSFAPEREEPSEYEATLGSTPSSLDASGSHYFYGGKSQTHGWFWRDYPWSAAPQRPAMDPHVPGTGRTYTPEPFASSTPSRLLAGAAIGTVAVAVSRRSGGVMGALLNRNGSWNRAESSYGGG